MKFIGKCCCCWRCRCRWRLLHEHCWFIMTLINLSSTNISWWNSPGGKISPVFQRRNIAKCAILTSNVSKHDLFLSRFLLLKSSSCVTYSNEKRLYHFMFIHSIYIKFSLSMLSLRYNQIFRIKFQFRNKPRAVDYTTARVARDFKIGLTFRCILS